MLNKNRDLWQPRDLRRTFFAGFRRLFVKWMALPHGDLRAMSPIEGTTVAATPLPFRVFARKENFSILFEFLADIFFKNSLDTLRKSLV
jgi:hypothetical protein